MSDWLNNNSGMERRKMWKDQLKKFLIDNNIVGTAAGVSIALVTKDTISSLVGDVLIPGIIFLLLKLNIQSLTEILPGKSEFDFKNFIKEFISWIFVVVITFLFVKIAFEGLLGVNDDSSSSTTNNNISTAVNNNS